MKEYSKEELEKMYPSVNCKRLVIALCICLGIILIAKKLQIIGVI